MRDMTATDGREAPAVRASILALFARLGAPGGRRGPGGEPLARAFEFEVALPEAAEVAAPALASRAANRARRLRDEARAAYAAVVGPRDAALDAALAVIEGQWQAAVRDRDRLGEALKAIRLYSADADSRQRARDALEACDDRRSAPCACGGRSDA
jgi:hypothetical protein